MVLQRETEERSKSKEVWNLKDFGGNIWMLIVFNKIIQKNYSVKENSWSLQPAPAQACQNSKSKAMPHSEV